MPKFILLPETMQAQTKNRAMRAAFAEAKKNNWRQRPPLMYAANRAYRVVKA
jgi:hypothetical protein